MPLIRKTPVTPPAPPADPAAMLALLANGTDDERWAAARAAPGLPGGTQALGAAIARERNPRVREAMFTGLARVATAASIELLLPFIGSDDAQLRTGALDALRAMKETVAPYVPRLFADDDADVRLLACEIVLNLPAESAARLLCDLLETELQPNVCAAAIEVLTEVGGSAALPVLARCEERFRATPFLAFSIKIAADRIRSESMPPRV